MACSGSIDAGQLAGVILGRQVGRDLGESRIAEVAGAVAEGPPHRLGHQVQRSPRAQRPCFFRSKVSRMLSISTRPMPPADGGGGA